MIYRKFSKRQMLAMSWWNRPKLKDYDGILCHGAVRSGKTVVLVNGFFLWSMTHFNGGVFAICGKTIASLRRNVLSEILPRIEALGAVCKEKRTENLVTVMWANESFDPNHPDTFFEVVE